MRRVGSKHYLLICLTAALAVAVARPAQAQLLGQVTTAKTLVPGTQDLGGFVGAFDHSTTVFGQYRRGLSNSLDFGLQAGLIDHDYRGSDASVIFGGDLKFNVMSTGADPFDMALDARTLFYDVGPYSLFSLGGAVIISRDYRLTQGSLLTPYGGVNIRLDHTSVDTDNINFVSNAKHGDRSPLRAAANDGDDTEINIGAVAGVKWELSDLMDAFGEVVMDDWGIVLGLNFKL